MICQLQMSQNSIGSKFSLLNRNSQNISTYIYREYSLFINQVIKMISYLIIFLIAIEGSTIGCGPGVPILTRIPQQLGKYKVQFQCLCPIDYFGVQCKFHRKINCYLTTKELMPAYVDSSNFQPQKQFNITIGAQCYLQESNQKFISFINYFFKKQTQKEKQEWQLQSGKNGGQIIWANNSDLLTQDGIVKYQQGYNFTEDEAGNKRLSKADEQMILYGNGPYKFNYKSQFLGFPLTDSSFQVTSDIYKILLNQRILPKQPLQFINYENYTNILSEAVRKRQEAKQYYQKFSILDIDFNKLNLNDLYKQFQDFQKEITQISKVDVVPLIRATIKANLTDETQFGMLKAQIRIEETYNHGISTHQTSINSANVRVPVRVKGIGEATVYNSNFYKRPSRIIYAFFGLLALGALFIVYRISKQRKIKKMKKIQMKVESQYEESELK